MCATSCVPFRLTLQARDDAQNDDAHPLMHPCNYTFPPGPTHERRLRRPKSAADLRPALLKKPCGHYGSQSQAQ